MKTYNQKIFATVLVLIGIVLLSINLGVISLEIKQFFVTFYPILIVLFGLKLLVDKIVKKSEVLFISLFLLSFGTLLCLDRLGFIEFPFMHVWKLWPILIIYIGIQMFSKNKPVKVIVDKDNWDLKIDLSNKDDCVNEKIDKSSKQSFTIGEMKMNKQNWSVEPIKLWNVVGDYYFDFSKAYIPDKETPIHIKGMVGDIKMLVPEGLPVKVDAFVKAGQINIFGEESRGKSCRMLYASPNFEESSRKINIVLDLKVGDVRIDRI